MVDMFEDYRPKHLSFIYIVRLGEILFGSFIVLSFLFFIPPVSIEKYIFG